MCSEQLEPLGRLIYHTTQKIVAQAENLLRPYDLTLEQLHLIKALAAEGELSQQGLGATAHKSAGNMTRLLNRLEKKGLVRRRANPEDGRSSLVSLTTKGLDLAQEITDFLEHFSASLTQGISEQEQEQARSVLRRMTANLKNME